MKNAKRILVRIEQLRKNCAINVKQHLKQTDCGMAKWMEHSQVLAKARGILC
jgi:hypothetical protein